jgi:CheY-like chemotaxis protein
MRVLIADDDPRALSVFRTMFESYAGVEVVAEAHTGAEAVQLALEHEPDLALLDVRMPGMDGFQAAEEIQSVSPSTEIILHSGELTPEDEGKAQKLGYGVIAKRAFGDSVESLLARRRQS